jgi:hypothetical protein
MGRLVQARAHGGADATPSRQRPVRRRSGHPGGHAVRKQRRARPPVLCPPAPHAGGDPTSTDRLGPPERIAFIVPSHMHGEQISALSDVPQAPVPMRDSERPCPGILRSQFAGVCQWRSLTLSGGPWLAFAHSQDLFTDCSVVLLPLGGAHRRPGRPGAQPAVRPTLPVYWRRHIGDGRPARPGGSLMTAAACSAYGR